MLRSAKLKHAHTSGLNDTQSVPIHTSICLHCHPKQLRMANEVAQKADQFEDLYSKLLKIQQSACVVGVPDRPAGIF